MAYRGRYIPTYPKKYKGDPSKIIYRSLWERKFMVYCDRNEKILEWGSEEFFVPYRSPLDGKIHRYFPDFYVKVKTPKGTKKWVVEVKPKSQTSIKDAGKSMAKKKQAVINMAKWEAANAYAKQNKIRSLF